jgi:hypothetical protein
MGGVIDVHQARLDSLKSCQCGEMSREGSSTPGVCSGSELSYIDPNEVQRASLPSIPSSIPPENIPIEDLHYVPSQDVLDRVDELQKNAEAEQLASCPSPRAPSFWGSLIHSPEVRREGEDLAASPSTSGRLVEVKDEEEEVDRAEDMPVDDEVSSNLFFRF